MASSQNSPGIAIREWMATESNGILQSVLSSVEYGFLLTDLDHVAIACNRRFGEIFGIDIQQVVESGVDDVRAMVMDRIADPEAWMRDLESIYSEPSRSHEDELELLSPCVTLRRSTVPLCGSTGQPIGRLWTFLDISAEARLDRMNKALTEMSLLFHAEPCHVYTTITESVGEFYGSVCLLSIVEDEMMRFAAVGGPSEQARQISGNSRSDSYCDFCLEHGGPLIIQDCRTDSRHAARLPAKMGLTRYAGVPLLSPEGSAIGTFCILDGRSEELLDENDLRFLSLAAMRISSELERERQLKGLERDLREAQAQLIQSEKLAVTGALSAAIAHDIRNILSALSLELSMGADQPAETLREIHVHIDRFHVLAHRLLSYAKPQELKLTAVKLSEVLARVHRLVRPHLELAHISFSLDLPPDLPAVRADSARLDHLFINLMMNALQSMREGSLKVEARAEKGAVIVTITDNGPGIPEDILPRLFEPFSSARPDGSGLGLYSCRQIAEECGGEISVETSREGTEFTVRLAAYESRHPDR